MSNKKAKLAATVAAIVGARLASSIIIGVRCETCKERKVVFNLCDEDGNTIAGRGFCRECAPIQPLEEEGFTQSEPALSLEMMVLQASLMDEYQNHWNTRWELNQVVSSQLIELRRELAECEAISGDDGVGNLGEVIASLKAEILEIETEYPFIDEPWSMPYPDALLPVTGRLTIQPDCRATLSHDELLIPCPISHLRWRVVGRLVQEIKELPSIPAWLEPHYKALLVREDECIEEGVKNSFREMDYERNNDPFNLKPARSLQEAK